MADGPLHCLVEIPKGSRNKYQWDEKLGGIKLARFLFSSVVYPTDYGFVPETLGLDGEALDELGQDDKLLCVPFADPNWEGIERLDDVPELMRNEIEHFFSMYKEPEGREVTIQGWEDHDVADQLLGEARERYRDTR